MIHNLLAKMRKSNNILVRQKKLFQDSQLKENWIGVSVILFNFGRKNIILLINHLLSGNIHRNMTSQESDTNHPTNVGGDIAGDESKSFNHKQNIAKPKDPLHKRSVFIGNLPPEAIDTDIEKIFRPYGTIEGIRIPRNHGTSRGHAFVQFETHGQAVRALTELGSIKLHGRTCYLRLAEPGPSEDRNGKRETYDRDRDRDREARRASPPRNEPVRYNDRDIDAMPRRPPMGYDERIIPGALVNYYREAERRKILMEQMQRERMRQRERSLYEYEMQLKQREMELSLRDQQIIQQQLMMNLPPPAPDLTAAYQAQLLQMQSSNQLAQQQILQAQMAQLQPNQQNYGPPDFGPPGYQKRIQY